MRKFLGALLFLLAAATANADVRRIELPGCWYVDALPTGEYAAACRGSKPVQSHLGELGKPEAGDGPLYLRLAATGPFRFAGQSHIGLGTWEFTNGGWQLRPANCGISGAIYDATGILRLSDCSIGSQGWRYVEDGTGRLVTGDATYADIPRQLWEWTTHGDITIGQGLTGCIALRNGERKLLERGDCHFARYNRSGDAISVAMAMFAEQKAVVLWFNATDLASFPTEVVTPPGPVDPPTPPVDPPVQNPAFPQNVFDTLVRVRNEYPRNRDLTDEEIGAILNKTAWIHRAEGVGLQAKPGGTSSVQPRTGVRIWNGLRFKFQGKHYGADVCGACSIHKLDPVKAEGGPADEASFITPVEPEGVTPPDPTVPDPPSPNPELLKRIAELEAKNTELQWYLVDAKANAESLTALFGQVVTERDQLLAEIVRIKADPCSLVNIQGPSFIRSLFGIHCEAK